MLKKVIKSTKVQTIPTYFNEKTDLPVMWIQQLHRWQILQHKVSDGFTAVYYTSATVYMPFLLDGGS